MARRPNEEEVEQRDKWVREQVRANNDIGPSTLQKMCKKEFGYGLDFYKAKKLKNEVLIENKPMIAKKKRRSKRKDPFKNGANLKSVSNGHCPDCPPEMKPILRNLLDSMRVFQYEGAQIRIGEGGHDIKLTPTATVHIPKLEE